MFYYIKTKFCRCERRRKMRKYFLFLLTVLMLSGVFLIPAEGQAQESQDVEALRKEVESLRSKSKS